MVIVDWRDPSVPSFAEIWLEQSARWHERLAWDSRANWQLIEQQRRAGRLPGFVLLDAGGVVGWTYFVSHHDTLQVGAFEACSEEATALLLEAIDALAAPPVARDGVLVFAFSAAPGLSGALRRHGYDVEPYRYLTCRIGSAGGGQAAGAGTDSARPSSERSPFEWSRGAARQLSSLFARAYGQPALTRPFARHGAAAEWDEYAAQLVDLHACGQFRAELSAVSISPDGMLEGAVVTTAIDAGTAHVAQVCVDPRRQRRGLARRMLEEVLAKAAVHGYERVSLLVGERNRQARALYDRLGFVDTAAFVSAGRGGYPRRSTSPAAVTGGASTFR